LGVTFAYAGLQKLANPNFFIASSPISIQNQLAGAARFSPIHSLLHAMLPYAGLLGMIIAYAEIAIGLGTLLGFMSRTAAIGGAVLSFNLFLAISFHSSPYFTGADIVFFFAWLPLVVAGSGSQLSLDAYLRRYVRTKLDAPVEELVSISFAQVQSVCGNFNNDTCTALNHAACRAQVCPVLLGDAAPHSTTIDIASIERRQLVVGGATAAAVGTAAVLLGASTAAVGKMIGNASSTSTSTTSTTTTTSSGGSSKGHLLGAASQVPVGSAATFTIPSTGDPGIVFHMKDGSWLGYDTVCPHAGCTVGWSTGATLMVCPCHGSEFEVSNGDVVNGPASHGLTALSIIESGGNLYLR
jgi:thiosulfate dehydrogenase [quinone] large subunit